MPLTPHPPRRIWSTVGGAVALALVLGGCASTADSGTTPTEDATTADSLLPAAEGTTDYPLTLQSPYGESVISERPIRVATVGANAMDAELLLAMGGVPVTVAGLGFNKAPWLIELADDRIETVFETESWDQYPYETLAAADPDVIVAFGYDLTDSFDKLSAIAPVVTSEDEWTGYFNNPWQDNIAILGEALDLSDAAERVVADYDVRIAQIREDHPEFDGNTLSYTVWFGAERGLSYQSLPGSIIAEVFESIGFELPPSAADFSETQTVSSELLASVDADVVIVHGSSTGTEMRADSIPGLTDSATFQSMSAWRDSRVVATENESPVGWAMSTAGPLGSIVALDILVPKIASVLE